MEKETIVCPCKKKNCPRHGDCKECRAHHEKSGRYAPYCERKAKKAKQRREQET